MKKKEKFLKYHKEYTKDRLKNISDYKGIILFSILFLGILGFLAFTSAAPPQSTAGLLERGVDIVHPETQVVKYGNSLEFNFWTYNSSTGGTLTNNTLNCTLYIINDRGVNFWRFSNQPGASALITYGKGAPLCVNCWTMTLPAQNLTYGVYSYQIKCQANSSTTTAVGGYYTGAFEVTPTGFSGTLGFYILLLILSLGIIILGYYVEDPWVIVLGSFGLVLFGLFILLYGVNGIKDIVYTYGFGIIVMMLGAYFGIKGSLENLN